MPEQSAQSAIRSVRRHFHWCLAAALLPVITLPLEWAVALKPTRKGRLDLRVRAFNRIGETQPMEALWQPAGYMRNVVESVNVNAA